MDKEKVLTIDDMPMHKDTYFFGYGIDIEKPYEMANRIIKQKEAINKAIELLGNYKHYSIPDEKQNSDNEDLVDKVLDILKEV